MLNVEMKFKSAWPLRNEPYLKYVKDKYGSTT